MMALNPPEYIYTAEKTIPKIRAILKFILNICTRIVLNIIKYGAGDESSAKMMDVIFCGTTPYVCLKYSGIEWILFL